MNPITHQQKRVDRQVVLPFFKSVEIAVKSIRVRFVRSMVVTISLVLAIAFLAFVTINHHILKELFKTDQPTVMQKVLKAGYTMDEKTNTLKNPTQKWVLFLSMLVCVVGIINAQLMSVSERFREIGTMKCLGALDRFILRLFLLEAAIEGGIGSTAGAILGTAFAFINALIKFGWAIIPVISFSTIGITIFYCMGIGLLLSLLGVFFPARMASRMQPVEAMRAEH